MATMSEAPSPFFEHNPKLQRAWDSTSLRALMFCPRYYQLSIQEGWRGSTLDLEFGVLAHGAFEVHHKARLAGKSREEAQLDAVQYSVMHSGHYDEEGTWVPWGGRYSTQWRCLGTEPYWNKKGNKAKCPYSHKGKWHDTDAPSVCGDCGSDIEQANRWLPLDRAKDRLGLVRMICWWSEEQADEFGTSLDPVSINGVPAVELSFKLPLPFSHTTSECFAAIRGDGSDEPYIAEETKDWGPFLLCGHLDGLAQLGDELFVRDHKTTRKTLGKAFFSGYQPNIQTDVYDLAGSLLYQDRKIAGLVIDGAQLLSDGAKFGSQVYYRTEAQREEFFSELEWWIRQAERYAEGDYWPMNRNSCWLCEFKGVCSKEPAMREMYLKADFKQNKWNPLEER